MCGMCPDSIDGCYDAACIRRGADGEPLKWYVKWIGSGEPYCEHLAATHGHPVALWWDRYGCENEYCDAPEGQHDADCPSLTASSRA